MIKVPENFFMGSKNRLLFPMHKVIAGATLFVEPQEYEDYACLWTKQFNVVALPENNRGFGYLLNRMLAHALERKYESYVFCDDDIKGFRFRHKGMTLLSALDAMNHLMRERDYAQVMMSFQGHNWYCKEQVKEKIGAWGCILNRTKTISDIGGAEEQLIIFNDWDISARLIKAGHKTACYYDAMFDHKMKSEKGGASEIYQNHQNLESALAFLTKRYGSKCVRRVWRHNQPEARFVWAKL